jgi:anti-anti-sigma regulatory factor
MTMNAVWLKVEGGRVVPALQEALEALDMAGGEVLLDFSLVDRIDATAIRAMEKLAAKAREKAGKVVLRGVHVDVYKVLKLTKLAPRLTFLS